MEIIEGDLIKLALEKRFDVIVHGCNCHCTMGAGIAKSIKKSFPEAYQVDCETVKGDRSKLGTITFAEVERNEHQIVIVNAYTQYHWRGTGVKADYEAIKSCMKEVKRLFGEKRIGYPLIGAGLAGGEWATIEKIIAEELDGVDHTLVKYKA